MVVMTTQRKLLSDSNAASQDRDVSHQMSAICLKLNSDKTEMLWVRPKHAVSQFSSVIFKVA